MNKLEAVLKLQKDTSTKAKDMLDSIGAIHGEDAERAIKLQYRLLTHMMNMTTALAAVGAPKPLVLMMAEHSQKIHAEVTALAMMMAVAHIEDDDKALAATKELMGFINQMGGNYVSAMEQSLEMGDSK